MRLKQESQVFISLGTEIKPSAGWVASIHDLSQRVSRACLKCIRAPHPSEFLRCLHRDDWRRRKAVLGRGPGWTDEIANLVSSSVSFSLPGSVSAASSAQHKQTQVQHIYTPNIPILSWLLSSLHLQHSSKSCVEDKKNDKGKKKKAVKGQRKFRFWTSFHGSWEN